MCVLVNVSGTVPSCCCRNFSLLSFGEEAEEDEEETMVVSKVSLVHHFSIPLSPQENEVEFTQ